MQPRESLATLVLQSSDGINVTVARGFLEKSVYLMTLFRTLNEEELAAPMSIPHVTAMVLKQIVAWYTQSTDDRSSDEDFVNQNLGMLSDLIIAAKSLKINELLTAGCRVLARMIDGRSVAEVQSLLNIQPNDMSTATTTIDFRAFSDELRQLCYEHLNVTAATIFTLWKALEGGDGYEDIVKGFVEWTGKILAIISPERKVLHHLAPNADANMYRPGVDKLCTRVDHRSRKQDDELHVGSLWRPTQHAIGNFDSFPIDTIKVDDKFGQLIRSSSDPQYLVLCKREELEIHARNWILFWPISNLVVMPHKAASKLDGAMNIFRSFKPEMSTLPGDTQGEYTRWGTLTTEEIIGVLKRIKNQEWSGYVPEECLKHSLDFISEILRWHDEPNTRYCCGQLLETPLSTADREVIDQFKSTFKTMLKERKKTAMSQMVQRTSARLREPNSRRPQKKEKRGSSNIVY